jgi:hypothetical protein
LKKLVIHTPKLAAVRFIGSFDKKLFEVGARKLPILKKEDDNVIIVSELEAAMLIRQPHFERANIESLFIAPNQEESTNESKEETDEDKTPQEDGTPTPNQEESTDELKEETDEEKTPQEDGTPTPNQEESTNESKEETDEEKTPQEDGTPTPNQEESTDELKLPFKEDIETLTDEEVKYFCERFGVKVGKKRTDTLKAMLLPYLPSREI